MNILSLVEMSGHYVRCPTCSPSTIPGYFQTAHNLVMKIHRLIESVSSYFFYHEIVKQQFRNERSRTWDLFWTLGELSPLYAPLRTPNHRGYCITKCKCSRGPWRKIFPFPAIFSYRKRGVIGFFLSCSQNMDNLCAYSPALCPLPSATP